MTDPMTFYYACGHSQELQNMKHTSAPQHSSYCHCAFEVNLEIQVEYNVELEYK